MATAWREDQITRVTFGHRTPAAAQIAVGSELSGTCPGFVQDLVERLQTFALSPTDTFLDVVVDVEHLTRFQREVVRQCRMIPVGRTLSYGELAERAGSPRAARAVGNVMATNRYPLIVPCHRVVGSGGRLGGYSAPDGLAMKRRLLQHEAQTP